MSGGAFDSPNLRNQFEEKRTSFEIISVVVRHQISTLLFPLLFNEFVIGLFSIIPLYFRCTASNQSPRPLMYQPGCVGLLISPVIRYYFVISWSHLPPPLPPPHQFASDTDQGPVNVGWPARTHWSLVTHIDSDTGRIK